MSKTLKISAITLFVFTLLVTAFDMQISNFLFRPHNAIAIWLRGYTYVPTYFIMLIALFIAARYFVTRFFKYRFLIMLAAFLGAVALNVMLTLKMYDYIQAPVLTMSIIIGMMLLIALFISSRLSSSLLYISSKIAMSGLLAYGVTFTVVTVLKVIWGRARYHGVLTQDASYTPWFLPSGLSTEDVFHAFPSGHTAFATLMLIIILIPMDIKGMNKWFFPLYTVLLVWITMVGISRIMLGSHFATDTTLSIIIVLIIIHFSKNSMYHIMDKYIKET